MPELDVPDIDLDIIGMLDNAPLPRRPNSISRRAHSIKFTITIFGGLPVGTTAVELSAYVVAYSEGIVGLGDNIFSTAAVWGSNSQRLPLSHTPSPDRPVSLSLEVRPTGGDDHLGQGPYGAFVVVTPSDESQIGLSADGNSLSSPPSSPPSGVSIPVPTGETFLINFRSQ